jgi:2-dehydro-3-deoxyphosphogluconate aldolase/(4S)-4-hydroxy-2-oxoglutarate aldolase
MKEMDFAKLEGNPVVPVVVLDEAEQALPLAEALLAGGIRVIEITLRTQAGMQAIELLAKRCPEILTGAGTVVTADQAKRALDAGASFGLAPGVDPQTFEIFADAGVPFIPGVMTPSEIQTALGLGCTYLKFFPAGPAGGPSMLKAIAAPYAAFKPRFCPTGGVSLANMKEYLNVSEVFAVGGSWIASRQEIAAGEWATITRKAAEAIERANS